VLGELVKSFDWIQDLYYNQYLVKNFKEDFSSREDFYKEDGNIVFTEEYHTKRGYCCESGCRHCPYKKF